MATTCKVYLSDGLPIEVNNAHRVLYFPDGSAHIFDKHDRPVFVAAPGRYSAISIDYALDEEVDKKQAVTTRGYKKPTAIVPVEPAGEKQEVPQPRRYEKVSSTPPGFPPVGDSKPAQRSSPGEVKITSLQDRGPDGESTQEMQIPIVEVPHQDFLRASQMAGRR